MDNETQCNFSPVSFAELEGWELDDHRSAFLTFQKSCAAVLKRARAETRDAETPPALLAACEAALSIDGGRLTANEARSFFEARFVPHRVEHNGAAGLMTAYYEPVLDGARVPGEGYSTPIYRRPPELVNLIDEAQRSAFGNRLTHARKTAAGVEPYFTRAEIESGALAGRDLEFVWLADPVETFVMHIQGSGRVRLPDDTLIRVTYDGKNGYPYTSVGRHLIETGQLAADFTSLDAMKDWLRADPLRGRDAMHENASFIFFRELFGAEAESAMGVLDIPLTPGRSLAVDTAFHDIGIPVWVAAPEIGHASEIADASEITHANEVAPRTGRPGFHRLMIAQDVGSAIKGPERGDLYVGSGAEAGRLAGITKNPGSFFVLLAAPKDEARSSRPADQRGRAKP